MLEKAFFASSHQHFTREISFCPVVELETVYNNLRQKVNACRLITAVLANQMFASSDKLSPQIVKRIKRVWIRSATC